MKTKVQTEPRFKELTVTATGGFTAEEFHPQLGPFGKTVTLREYKNGKWVDSTVAGSPPGGFYARTSAGFPLFIIAEAWARNLDLEAEADGYGPGAGTFGDWSGIRDSSPTAIDKMLEKSLNFLFPSRHI